jgi:hypothetical protein
MYVIRKINSQRPCPPFFLKKKGPPPKKKKEKEKWGRNDQHKVVTQKGLAINPKPYNNSLNISKVHVHHLSKKMPKSVLNNTLRHDIL